ncbi:erythromycin esterase family protein [Paenibacillus sp. YYML68]|uniref:erythromycin esterase family protein n=1 Tax=Paenibacillus sp. YYML68 TaxID=2909250 RepID=UPI002491863A|nr:erythromycin esterase family protein [Paenibacillus sp. YYML68]
MTPQRSQPTAEAVRRLSHPFHRQEDLNVLIPSCAASRFVLLGEASHGTSEFYSVRAELTRRLISEQGFRFIAVEGDWPACFEVNRYVKGLPGAATTAKDALLQAFNRWPIWMWANEETESLIEWLKFYNESQPPHLRVGFYGIDVYSLWESMEAVIAYLERTNSEHVDAAKKAFACFGPFGREAQSYGLSASIFGEGCEKEVVELLTKLRIERGRTAAAQEDALDAEMNALVALHAEHYYRTMITDDVESWNIRDRHMTEAVLRIADYYGHGAKGLVWEHNTHIGDARATDMAADGMVNVGQLLREQTPEGSVYAVGFGTHRGTVMAAYGWGETPSVMEVPPARDGSREELLHQLGSGNRIILFDAESENGPLQEPIGHRAIGVVYHPQNERGNYVPSRMPTRYNAFVYIEETKAVRPLAAVYALV